MAHSIASIRNTLGPTNGFHFYDLHFPILKKEKKNVNGKKNVPGVKAPACQEGAVDRMSGQPLAFQGPGAA